MKIPKALNILGKNYRVLNEEPVPSDAGECDYTSSTIRVSPKQSRDNQADTLLHELLHAISEELQLRMSERQVRLGATGLLAVMRANPGFVTYLTAS